MLTSQGDTECTVTWPQFDPEVGKCYVNDFDRDELVDIVLGSKRNPLTRLELVTFKLQYHVVGISCVCIYLQVDLTDRDY